MDFKVAGTRKELLLYKWILKSKDHSKILEEALEAAKKARYHILDNIEAEISKPREELCLCLKLNQ